MILTSIYLLKHLLALLLVQVAVILQSSGSGVVLSGSDQRIRNDPRMIHKFLILNFNESKGIQKWSEIFDSQIQWIQRNPKESKGLKNSMETQFSTAAEKTWENPQRLRCCEQTLIKRWFRRMMRMTSTWAANTIERIFSLMATDSTHNQWGKLKPKSTCGTPRSRLGQWIWHHFFRGHRFPWLGLNLNHQMQPTQQPWTFESSPQMVNCHQDQLAQPACCHTSSGLLIDWATLANRTEIKETTEAKET